MTKKEKRILLTILESIEKILNYTDSYETPENFYNDEMPFEATMLNFVIIGEMVSKLSDFFKEENDSVNWRKLKEFRKYEVCSFQWRK